MAQTKTQLESAYFAGGCFWCMEEVFEKLAGVEDAISGYTGGDFPNPSYEDVIYKNTGHFEAIKVIYDSSKVSYEQLLDLFWLNVDPTQNDGQFCDKGPQYRSAIFFATTEQKQLAETSKAKYQDKFKSRNPVGEVKFATDILALKTFYDAEEYHQSYYKKKFYSIQNLQIPLWTLSAFKRNLG
ncbi:hypothetical protein KUTeg_000885 [Tegillarca granosa]|uniref:peptide-methionine (S)-S-oxide reductase n=1 Tax=Tegillarca granosa TaxID=220873 RepID=A0ABQ9FWD8_TEGGR|nr:hypothetical protein KUTeg_000885 [Tegillarca granosa]